MAITYRIALKKVFIIKYDYVMGHCYFEFNLIKVRTPGGVSILQCINHIISNTVKCT